MYFIFVLSFKLDCVLNISQTKCNQNIFMKAQYNLPESTNGDILYLRNNTLGGKIATWTLGWTKISKSFQNLVASWYILYQHGYRPFLQKNDFFCIFLAWPPFWKKWPVLKGKWGKNIKKTQNGKKSLFEVRFGFLKCLFGGFGG